MSIETRNETALLNDLIDIRSANDWLSEAKKMPMPKTLLGDLWFEGELAIMFGDTGIGKTALAVQIGESIARGSGFAPMPLEAKPQTVLYFDFELSRKQFELRYTCDDRTVSGGKLRRHYRFSERLKRIELSSDAFRTDGKLPLEMEIRRSIEPAIKISGAKVLIIDNITYLKRTDDNSRDSIPMMKELKRLKTKYGLSILVIAHTPKRDVVRPLVLNDMQGSKSIANFADSVFAIGQSRADASERYLKQIKARSSAMFYGPQHMPVFCLKKINGNFLGLEFKRFAPESEMLRETANSLAWEMINKIKALSDEGLPIRKIAGQMAMSRSAVHRYLQMWRPQPEKDVAESEAEVEENEEDPRTKNMFYFPGSEEYDAAKDSPRFNKRNFIEWPRELKREYGLIERAAADARKVYLATGVAPKLWENAEYREFKESLKYEVENTADPPEDLHDLASDPGSDNDRDDDMAEKPEEILLEKATPLRTARDGYGREIFIEAEDEKGQPLVWYQYDQHGTKYRKKRTSNGINVQTFPRCTKEQTDLKHRSRSIPFRGG